ncbi:MAG: recombination mediator RecR [Armatimonadota bacterium]|nr:recombination mediator RecR [Armatimonadota bacterium]MDR7422723.1 recombination mediator RecR [Armatimonadota bacterium]MDR7454037.1 recombination mediator RecR [Armatimonadota bacterium]MDR7457421.1 recombination mediator RecR [Armatimonadota bacterium]MDR7497615.1 recombination mediator RecR [Armatimonadota bacterium]
MDYPGPLARLIDELSKMPTVGPKTAQRLAFHILRLPPEEARALAEAIVDVKAKMRYCSVCFTITDVDPCATCADPARRDDVLCVVEDPRDVLALERTREFRGRYHVLHGAISPLDGIGPDDLKIAELLARVRDGAVREVIVATNPRVEGEATAIYLARLLKPLGLRVTRIAHGLPVGGDLEYADEVTLARALEGRRDL